MTPVVHVTRAEGIETPDDDSFSCWVTAALLAAPEARFRPTPEISIRLTDSAEMAELNERFRKKTGPTNVLSFPMDLPLGVAEGWLGDIVICAPVVSQEAYEQRKSVLAHWAHMTVHGLLHLLGHDHIDEVEAQAMESLEAEALVGLGFGNPYLHEPPEFANYRPEGG